MANPFGAYGYTPYQEEPQGDKAALSKEFTPKFSARQLDRLISSYKTNPRRFKPEDVDQIRKHAIYHNKAFFEGDFSIMEALAQFGGGVIEGFSTFSPVKTPDNEYESLARSVGHLIGFAPGMLAKPLKILGLSRQAAAISTVKSIPLALGEKFQKRTKKYTDTLLDRIIKKRTDATETAAKFITRGGVESVVDEAVKLGAASAISNFKQGIPGMVEAARSGGEMGAAFQILGNLVPGSSKFAYLGRAIAGSIYQGAHASGRGLSTPEQIYEYILGAYFGGGTAGWVKKGKGEFFTKMNKQKENSPELRVSNDITQVKGWNKIDPYLQKEIIKETRKSELDDGSPNPNYDPFEGAEPIERQRILSAAARELGIDVDKPLLTKEGYKKLDTAMSELRKGKLRTGLAEQTEKDFNDLYRQRKDFSDKLNNLELKLSETEGSERMKIQADIDNTKLELDNIKQRENTLLALEPFEYYKKVGDKETIAKEDRVDDGNDIGMISRADMFRKSEKFVMDNLSDIWDKPEYDGIAKNNELVRLTNIIDNVIRQPKYMQKEQIVKTDELEAEIKETLLNKENFTFKNNVIPENSRNELRQFLTRKNFEEPVQFINVRVGEGNAITGIRMRTENGFTDAGNRKIISEPKKETQRVLEEITGDPTIKANVLFDNITTRGSKGEFIDMSLSQYRRKLISDAVRSKKSESDGMKEYTKTITKIHKNMAKDGYYPFGGKGDNDVIIYIKEHPSLKDSKITKRVENYIENLKGELFSNKKYYDQAINRNKHFSKQDAKKHYISNVLWDLSLNGFKPVTQAEFNVALDKLFKGKGYIKNATAWNKRQQIWFTPTYRLDKTFIKDDYKNFLANAKDNFKIPIEFTNSIDNGKARYIIAKDLSDDLFVKDANGNPTKIRIKPLTTKSKNTEYDENVDGQILVEDGFLDSIVKDGGMPSESGQSKSFIVSPDNTNGALLGKYMMHSVGETASRQMREAGIHMIMQESAVKQRGERKITDYDIKNNKLEIANKDLVYELPLEHIKYNFNVKQDNTMAGYNPDGSAHYHRMPKQLLMHMAQNTYVPFQKKLIDDFMNETVYKKVAGKKEINEAYQEYKKFPESKVLLKKLSKNIEDLGIDNLLDAINGPRTNFTDAAYIELAKINKKLIAEQVAEGEISKEKANEVENNIDDFVSTNDRMVKGAIEWSNREKRLGRPGNINPILLHKYNRKMTFQVVRNYIFQNISKPKIENSGVARMRGYDKWFRQDKKFADLETKDDIFYLDDSFKKMPLKTHIKGYEDTTLERLWNAYSKENGDLYQNKDAKDAITALTVRVPMDSTSGAQKMEFAGFTGRKGHGILMHSRAMRAEGGADLDGDESFIFFAGRRGNEGGGFKNSWIDAFGANKGEYYKEDGTIFNNKNKQAEKNLTIQDSIKETGVDPKARDSKMWQYDSQWRQDISERAVDGRNLLGGAVTMSQVLKATHNSISSLKNKSITWENLDGEKVTLTAKDKPADLQKARELASSMVAFTSDPLDVAGLTGYRDYFRKLTNAYFDVKATGFKQRKGESKEELTDRIYAHIGNTGPYSRMKDINSALYSRNFKDNRAYESHEIQALTDSVNEGFLKNAEARNTMLPKIGKVANELDIYDSIFRKINFQRLDDMYNEHAQIMKVMPELKDLYKNIKVTKPEIVNKIKNSHLYEIDKLRRTAMDLKVYDSIIETEGSIYKKGSEYRDTAKYDAKKAAEPKAVSYREQKLKEVVRAVEEYLTNDVTDMVTLRQTYKHYDAQTIGPVLFSKILKQADRLKAFSYLQRDSKTATHKIGNHEVNRATYESFLNKYLDLPDAEIKDQTTRFNQADIDNAIVRIKETLPNDRARDILDVALLGSMRANKVETATSKLGFSSRAVSFKNVVDFVGDYSYIMNKAFKGTGKENTNLLLKTLEKGDMAESNKPKDGGIIDDTSTGYEGLHKNVSIKELPRAQRNVITELAGRLREYNNKVTQDLSLITRQVIGKNFNAMNFQDIMVLNNYFKELQTGTVFQKHLTEKYPKIYRRHYWQFPETVGREQMKFDIQTFKKRGLFVNKFGKAVQGDMLQPTNFQEKLMHAVSVPMDKAEGKAEERILELRKDLDFVDAIEDGESLRRVAIRDMELVNAYKKLHKNEALSAQFRELYKELYQNEVNETNYKDLTNKTYRINVETDDGFKRVEETGQQIVKRIQGVYQKFFDKMYNIIKGDEVLLDKYHVRNAKGKRQYWDAKDWKEMEKRTKDKRTGPIEPKYDYRKFVKDIYAEYEKGLDITSKFGIDGLRAIARSMMVQLHHKRLQKFKSQRKLREQITIPSKTNRIEEGYWPHMFFNKSDVNNFLRKALKRIQDSNLTDAEKIEEQQRILLRGKTLTGDWLTGTENWEAYDFRVDPSKTKDKSKRVTWFEANQMTGSMHKRETHIPGWSIDATIADSYAKNTTKVYYKQLSQILARDILVDYDTYAIKKGWDKVEFDPKTGRTLKDRWSDYYKLYVQDAMGHPTVIPDYMLNDPGMKLKGTPYAWWADSNIREKVDKLSKKLGIKPMIEGDKNVGLDDIIRYSNFEGKLQLMSLLAHPKSAVANVFGGTLHTIQSAGFENLRLARNYEYLRKINPEFTNRQAVKDFAMKQGVFPEMLMHEWGMQRQLQDVKTKNFLQEVIKKIGKSGEMNKEKFKKLASEAGVTDRAANFAAKFMSIPEMALRTDAFITHYIQAYKRFGGSITQYDHPFLIEMAKKGVKATQFLYNAPNRPAFARTGLGKIMTRFQLWSWNATKFRNDVVREARIRGYQPGTAEYQRFKRTAMVDMLVYGLGSVFAMSLFDLAIPAPLNYLKDTTEWIFGDEKEREKAFWGTYPTALAPLQIITPPIGRYPISILKALSSDDFDKFLNYHLYMMFPFGRIARDVLPFAKGNIIDNPYRTIEKFTGLPYSDVSKLRKELRNNTAYHPKYGGIERFGLED